MIPQSEDGNNPKNGGLHRLSMESRIAYSSVTKTELEVNFSASKIHSSQLNSFI